MGNGYPITAVIDKKIMNNAQDTFMSSTFGQKNWPSAALKAEFMKKNKTWKHIIAKGKYLKKG